MAEDDSLLIKFVSWILVFIVFAILIFCWVVFVVLVCVPLFDYNWAWPISYLIVFHLLFFLVISSYLKTIFTTSFVPKSFTHNKEVEESEQVEDNESDKIEETDSLTGNDTDNNSTISKLKKRGKPRYCAKCEQDKPDRAHHCSRCGRCVLKMDHHCMFYKY